MFLSLVTHIFQHLSNFRQSCTMPVIFCFFNLFRFPEGKDAQSRWAFVLASFRLSSPFVSSAKLRKTGKRKFFLFFDIT